MRTAVSTAQRYVVLLEAPPSRTACGSRAAARRRWRCGVDGHRRGAAGAVPGPPVRRRSAYRARVPLREGAQRFSARLDPTSLALLDRDREVEGVFPVRIAYPAQADASGGVLPSSVADLEISGLDGTGVTVALLDTGSTRHIRTYGGAFSRASTSSTRAAAGSPSRIRRFPAGPSATEPSSPASSPDPKARRAPWDCAGASILPVRVAGWANAEGGYTVYSRTDQILAGLEAAVDPNDDGDVHDAARIALIGVVEPYAAFPDGPLARAVSGAATLDTLTIVPAGNDGDAGPGYGASPARGRAGRRDRRSRGRPPRRPDRARPRRAGLRVLFEDVVPLGGAPSDTVTAESCSWIAPPRRRDLRPLLDGRRLERRG